MTDKAAAIARIVQAAGKGSSNLDRAEFWSAVVCCVAGFRFRLTYGKASFIRGRRVRFNKIRKHAKELASLLADDEAEEDVIGDNWREILPTDIPSPRQFAGILYRLLDKDLKHLREGPLDSFGGDVSAFEWLAGSALPSVYKKFFSKPSFTRTPQGPTGPFIHFVLAVLTEFKITNRGKQYRPETVAAALTKARAGRPRRKGKTP